MMNQPTPKVNRSDVVRIVNRDYSRYDSKVILEILSKFGTANWHREIDRVHLAAMKLALGDIDGLRKEIDEACCDYRNVLMGAEYPAAAKHGGSNYVRGERAKIYQADWDQYEKWLNR